MSIPSHDATKDADPFSLLFIQDDFQGYAIKQHDFHNDSLNFPHVASHILTEPFYKYNPFNFNTLRTIKRLSFQEYPDCQPFFQNRKYFKAGATVVQYFSSTQRKKGEAE